MRFSQTFLVLFALLMAGLVIALAVDGSAAAAPSPVIALFVSLLPLTEALRRRLVRAPLTKQGVR